MSSELLTPFNGIDPRKPPPATLFVDFEPLQARAFKLVRRLDHQQLYDFANTLTWMVDEYFTGQMEVAINRYAKPGSRLMKYIPSHTERNERAVRLLFEAGLPVDAQREIGKFPTRANTTHVQALKACVDQYDFAVDERLKKATPSKLFAVLALQLIGFGVQFLDRPAHIRARRGRHREVDTYPREKALRSVAFAHGAALEAMEAICHAEHLEATESLRKEIRLIGDGFRAYIHSQKSAARIQHERSARHEAELEHRVQMAGEQIAKKKISALQSKKAARLHELNLDYQVKSEALRFYEEHKAAWGDLSAEKVAEELAKFVPLAVRTLAGYIREYRRTHGEQRPRGRPRKKR